MEYGKEKGPEVAASSPNTESHAERESIIHRSAKSCEQKSGVENLIPEAEAKSKIQQDEDERYPSTPFQKNLKYLKLPWRNEDVPDELLTNQHFVQWINKVAADKFARRNKYTTTSLWGHEETINDFVFDALTELAAAGIDPMRVDILSLIQNGRRYGELKKEANTGKPCIAHHRRQFRWRTAVGKYVQDLLKYLDSGKRGPMPSMPTLSTRDAATIAAVYNKVLWDLYKAAGRNCRDSTGVSRDMELIAKAMAHVADRIPFTTFKQTGHGFGKFSRNSPELSPDEQESLRRDLDGDYSGDYE